ncbi:hypothetical protein [Rhizobium leguminosarum]|uniref:hypothetical protein n=1 Tax=Rhizobium leguminosarum TaxID=384 RepID=UPI0024A84EAD|nr:hypothetical protein [Rhizobium leguminosarum]MDI5929011.1 hypothetical protein [Rhizobium leguminosarum]
MAFPVSSYGKDLVLREIPPAFQANRGLLGTVTHGDFKSLDASMFASLRGKTLVVVGHVETIGGKPAFEIPRDDGDARHLPMESLQRVSEEIGFNLIPLGCETTESFAVGTATKITDVDGLQAFMRAVSRSGKASYLDVLADMSDANLKFVIDLARLGNSNMVPIDIIDRNGTQYRPAPPRMPQTPEAPQPTAGPTPGFFLTVQFSGLPLCEVSVVGLALSRWITAAAAHIAVWFPYFMAGLLLFFILIASFEVAWFNATTNVAQASSSSAKFDVFYSRRKVSITSMANLPFLRDLGAALASLGILVAFYGYFAISFGRISLDLWGMDVSYQALTITLFLLASIIVIEWLGEYKTQRRIRRIAILAKIGLVTIGALALTHPADALFAAFGTIVLLMIVFTPLVVHRVAKEMKCRGAALASLLTTVILAALITGRWLVQFSADMCWLTKPIPV